MSLDRTTIGRRSNLTGTQVQAHAPAEAEFVIRRISASRLMLVRVVQSLLEDLLHSTPGSLRDYPVETCVNVFGVRQPLSTARLASWQPSPTVTLSNIARRSQLSCPGDKRKRAETHIGSIAIASILPHAASIPPWKVDTPVQLPVSDGSIGHQRMEMSEHGRAVITRKRIGLGRLLSGLKVERCEGAHSVQRDLSTGRSAVSLIVCETDDDTDSEDEDLIVII